MPTQNHTKKRRTAVLVAVVVISLGVLVVVSTGRGWFATNSTAGPDELQAEDEHGAVEWTSWTEGLEVFVAHPYANGGEPFELAVHATRLETGEPLLSGSVTVRLDRGADVTELVALDPVAPGVWLVPVPSLDPGSYQAALQLKTELSSTTIHIEAPPLTVYETKAAAYAASKDAAHGSVAEVHFLKEQQWRIAMQTVVLQPGDIAERLVVPGTVVAPHGSEAMILPPVPGRVTLPQAGRFPHVGDRVTAGQVLAVIEPSVAGAQSVQLLVNQAQLRTLDAELAAKQLDIEARIASSQADLELANQEFERMEGLSVEGVVAEKRLAEARHRQKQAQAALQGYERSRDTYADAHQRLANFLGDVRTGREDETDQDSLKVFLRSPLAGSVVAMEATAGEYVGDDHLLFRVVDMQKLFIDAEVSEYDIAKVEGSQGATFRLSAYPQRVLPIFGPGDGRLVFIGAVVNPRSRTVSVRYEVPNEQGLLRLGMFADVMIETSRRTDALVVAQRAVVDDSGEPVVYVQTGGESFERRPVRLGIQDGDDIQIDSGLAVGERVVRDGAYAIRLSTLAGGVPEHHHH